VATKTVTVQIDDLDQEPGEDISTVPFKVDGVEYAIDLREANAERFMAALSPYIAAARRIGGKSTQRATGYDPRAVRKWARENNIPINNRGRVAADIVARWREAVG
jgi:hypothetical protein